MSISGSRSSLTILHVLEYLSQAIARNVKHGGFTIQKTCFEHHCNRDEIITGKIPKYTDLSVLDFTGQRLKKIELVPNAQPSAVIYDKNVISKLENLEKYKNLQQLSAAENCIVRMVGMSKLKSLCVINLPNNSIVSIEGLKDLKNLTWLSLSGNSIKVIEHLTTNVKLRHLDLSDNCISTITDISNLVNLKTLLLHGNMLTNLKTVPTYLPKYISVLSLAENELTDLNEISCLSSLTSLEQLSIMNNPCVLMTASSPGFDYRPFVINWCLNLKVLDGYIISEKESLKSEWLYSQGKGRHFHLGDHYELTEYLAELCPLTGTAKLETIEEARLNQILSKQKYHQEQLGLQQEEPLEPSTPTLTPTPEISLPSITDLRKDTSPSDDESSVRSLFVASEISTTDTSTFSREPIKAWICREGSLSVSSLHQEQQQQIGPSSGNPNLQLQDVVSEEESEDDVTSDLLESESVYLPFDFARSPDQSQDSMLLSHTSEDSTMQTGIPVESVLQAPSREDIPRPATTSGINMGSKYDAYEKRPIKPLNQELGKTRIPPPTFQYAPPMQSDAEPKVGMKKRSNSPLIQAQDYDVTGDSEKDQEVVTDDAVSKANLSNIKDIAQAKKLQKMAQKTNTGRKLPQPIISTTTQKATEAVRCRTAPASIAIVSHCAGETAANSRTDRSIPRKASEHLLDDRKPAGPWIDNYMAASVRDSGFLSRPVSDATDCLATEDENTAVTKIQAFWRGYWARQYNPVVVSVRKEIRVRRTEDHLIFLRAELERQRSLYEEEKQLRNLQLEAIRHLWKEVQALQSWKTEVLSSNILSQHLDSNRQSQKHSNRELQNTMEKIDLIKGQNEECRSSGESSTVTVTSEAEKEKRLELERTCVHLQSQVMQLRQLLQNVSQVVYSRDYFAKAFEDPTADKKEGTIRVTGNFEITKDSLLSETLNLSQWGNVPHSLSPYPSDEEHFYFWQVPHLGCPTPPKGLRLTHKNMCSLMLKWQSSKIIDESQQEVDKPVLGYRVYVNDLAKGMVSGEKTYAMVEGLDPQLTYKLYVKAVSNIGESYQSDVVMAALSKSLKFTRTVLPSSSSDNNHTDDSDKDHDSTESLGDTTMKRKRELSLRNSQRSKRKSPRREKDKESEKSKKGMMEHDKSDSVAKGDNYDPFSRKDSSSADEITILRHARLHTPKGGRSRDRQTKSPENVLLSSGAESTLSQVEPCLGDAGDRLSTLPPTSNRSPRDQDSGHSASLPVSGANVIEHSPCSETSSGASPKETESNSDVARSDSSREDKVKTHRRQRSKDIPNIMSELALEENSLSVVKTGNEVETESSSDAARSDSNQDQMKSHRRTRSKDMPNIVTEFNQEDVDGGQVKDKGMRERSHSFSSVAGVIQMIEDREKKDSSSDGSGKEKGGQPLQRKKRSGLVHDLKKENTQNVGMAKMGVGKVEGKDRGESLSTVLSKPMPVIDGRKRHSSGQGSRPNSPMAQDGGEKEVVNKPPIMERRRTPVVDMLEQRFASKMSSVSSTGSVGSQTEKPSNVNNNNSATVGKTTEGQRSRHGSGEVRDLSDDEVRRTKSENSSPTDKHHLPAAFGSDSDSSLPPSSKNKTHSSNFVSKLLQKLQTFSKSQEQTIRDSKKTLKSRAKSASDSALAGGRDEMRGPTRVRTISADEASGEEDNRAVPTVVHSDSSSATVHSEGKKKFSKGHKRSSSHGAGPIVAKGVHNLEGAHSPIIMEGVKKRPNAVPVTGVRRHASFHGLLPSKSHDICQPHGSDENLSTKKSATKPAPTESSGQPTFRSRSPSPNTSTVSGVYQPVLSAAQLQRLKSPPGVGQ